jgi:hypothetical protein
MKIRLLTVILLGFAMGANAVLASSAKSRPTCDEKPTLRDCVKVEDPNASAPAPSVYRQTKPAQPIARPLPAAGGAIAR